MADVATLTARLEALRAARASGVLTVRLATDGIEQHLTHKSDAEMAAAILDLERQIAAAAGTRPVRTIVVRNAGGW